MLANALNKTYDIIVYLNNLDAIAQWSECHMVSREDWLRVYYFAVLKFGAVA